MDEAFVARFWSKVDKNGPVPQHDPALGACWVWTGWRIYSGYGQIAGGGRRHYVHRVAVVLSGRDLPAGMQALHRCDNPPCVRPDHIYVGSRVDNMRDMAQRGRSTRGRKRRGAAVGTAVGSAKLTEAQVFEIFATMASGQASSRNVAARYGVAHTTVLQIARCKRWKHLFASPG